MMLRGRLGASVLSLLLFLLSSAPVSSFQTPTAVEPAMVETTTNVTFPEGISFETTLPAEMITPPDRFELFYRPFIDSTLSLAVVDPGSVELSSNAYRIGVTIDLQTDYMPSGIELSYFWRATAGGVVIFESRPEVVSWMDSRFEWSTVGTDQIQLHTYHLSSEFANTVAEIAQATVTSQEQRFGMQASSPMEIWIYENATDFEAVKQLNSREAVAGASYPGYYVIHVILGEGDDREVGRTITHEVSHQCLFQATENPYAMPPLWFDEGLATHAQTAGDESYLPLAVSSATSGNLYRLDSLSQGFPFLPAEAAVAYATSWSAIEFILQRWGDEGIALLIDQFELGIPPDEAIQQALGLSLDELDSALKEWLLMPPSNQNGR